jgi:GTP pyrophosphokinase
MGIKTPNLSELARHFKQTDADNLLEAIGRGDINTRHLAAFFKIPELEPPSKKPPPISPKPNAITVAGVDNIHTTLASCCTPIPDEDIIGYISLKKGITVHRKNCENILKLSPEKQARLVYVSWSGLKLGYSVPIVIRAFNSQNLLKEVLQVLTQTKIQLTSAALNTRPDFSAELDLTLQIKNTDQLSHILHKISCLPNVLEVKRKT